MTGTPVDRVREDCNRLRGRLFEALEATGMPDRQCDAIKSLVRRITYDVQANLEATLRGKDPDARYPSD